jgi:hypothetical protein
MRLNYQVPPKALVILASVSGLLFVAGAMKYVLNPRAGICASNATVAALLMLR